MAPALILFALAAAAHAGFQVTVSVLVYPRLAATRAEEWAVVHGQHSRRIAPVVAVLYGALLVTGAWAAAGGVGPWLGLSLGAVGATMLVTAVRAAPLHGRLDRQGPDPQLVASLLRADHVRTVLAVLGLVAAAVSVLTA